MGFTKSSLPTSSSPSTSSPKRRPIILGLFFLLTFSFIFFLTDTFPRAQLIDVVHLQAQSVASFPSADKVKTPRWFEAFHGTHLAYQRPLRVGMVNIEDTGVELLERSLEGFIDSAVTIDFEPVSPNVTWKRLFPEWIHEDRPGRCPRIPMPEPGKYLGLDMVVAQLPCRELESEKTDMINDKNSNDNKTTHLKEGIRDVQRLQVSLATASLIVENQAKGENDVYAVFIGKCEPMLEIFRCDDLVWHEGEYWVYKPNVERLRELISMPVGTCALAHPYAAAPGSRQLQANPNQLHEHLQVKKAIASNQRPRHAYVTLLHSSEDYVCGAIALAQSIRETNSTKDLVLLADSSISDHSISGLQAAGWKVKRIERIRSPHARINAYNEWNYSKLRVWQLTEYDKLMFIDADFIVLHNIDHFFDYPQLSAAPNNKWLFNSGIMILEPSKCFFDTLMSKRYNLKSYNGGDQGYLNEVLTWWHRLTTRLNFMKFFPTQQSDRSIPEDRHTIHFLGFKPWTCYRDYDCNWDRADYHRFASDDMNARWWQVYDGMSTELQAHCGMTQEMDRRVRKRREIAQKKNLFDGHWKIIIKDPRQFQLQSSV